MRRLVALVLLMSILSTAVLAQEKHYTREHAEELHHLIEWREYGPDAFAEALEDQKGIYLVISAPAWCYWCHVYESEDYLFHPSYYPYINEHYVPIFVDSDKRPDLTRKYLEGGWPSTTIFLPNMQRVQGFSGPRPPSQMLGFLQEVTARIEQEEFIGNVQTIQYEPTNPIVPDVSVLTQIQNNYASFLARSYDTLFGGLGTGSPPAEQNMQKFPRPLSHLWLVEDFARSGEHLDIVTYTFENQYTSLSEISSRYHLYDPVEGGFHRYGTQRDWSVPHFEKMGQDQAKFLLLLGELNSAVEDARVEETFEGTKRFVLEKLYDSEGGFYSSQDAHLEGEFFYADAEIRSTLEQPYIDKTRIMDVNGLMIYAFLQNGLIDEALASLDFIEKHMIGREGAFYYYDYDSKTAGLTGQSQANSYALLAFAFGAKQDGKYLKTAREIADYSLDNLYDWTSGGFFNRNSNDVESYAPNERIDLSKPYRENAVFAFAFITLYEQTQDLRYLEAAMKTIGYLSARIQYLDETYFVLHAMKTAEGHLDTYREKQSEVGALVENEVASFWVDDLLAQQEEGIVLDNLPTLENDFADAHFILLALLAFVAGILSFLSPCTLPLLTAYAAQSAKSSKETILSRTVLFFLGIAVVFSLFGMGATFLGGLFRSHRGTFTMIAGGLIILFGVLELFGKGFSGLHLNIRHRKTALGHFLFGALFGIGWSACIGPILASLLLLAATTGTIVKGTLLLFIYALGLGLPLLLISFVFSKQSRMWKWLRGVKIRIPIGERYVTVHSTSLITGLILIILGLLIFNDVLFSLNQYALQMGYVQEIILKGEEFLKGLFL